MKKFLVIFEKSKDGYGAFVPQLPGCVAVADTKEETEELIYEAIKFHIEGMQEEGLTIPDVVMESEMMVFA